jgi:hypothetical protein
MTYTTTDVDTLVSGNARVTGPRPWADVLAQNPLALNGVVDAGPAWNNARASLANNTPPGGIVFVPAGSYNLITAFTFGGQTNVTVLISAGVTLTGVALPVATGTNAFLDLRGVGGAIPLSGGATLTGNLLFSPDSTYTIGQSLASRPLAVYSQTFTAERSGAALGWLRSHPATAVMEIGTTSAHDISFITSGVDRWHISSGGNLTTVADSAFDFGASGANRPRDGFFAQSVSVGARPTANTTWAFQVTRGGGLGVLFGDTTQGADAKYWDFLTGTNQIQFRAINDAINVANPAWQVERTGTTIAAFGLGTHLKFLSDNTYDIGISASTFRPRTLWVGTDVNAGNNLLASNAVLINGLAGAYLNVGSKSAGTPNTVLRGFASQTADMLQIQNSAAQLIFQFTSLAAMVNGLQFIPGNAGSPPRINSIGTDANIALQLSSQGTGAITLYSNTTGSIIAQFAAVASAVDFIQFLPAATASPATLSISAQGTDANVNLNNTSKGTGSVQANGVPILTSGVTAAIATGATVAHGLPYTPTVVLLTAQDATPTAVFPSAIGATTFTINYTGGGTHAFAWSAR